MIEQTKYKAGSTSLIKNPRGLSSVAANLITREGITFRLDSNLLLGESVLSKIYTS